jgi:mannose/fructose-specific phosphotransferase system component IIA
MRKILLVSHGRLASGIKNSIDVLLGDSSAVIAIDAYLDNSDYTIKIKEFIDKRKPNDEAIIFTDILGGSVFQKVLLEEPEKKGVLHVTGMNLPVVIECLLTPEKLTEQTVDKIASTAASQLKRVSIFQEGSTEPQNDKDFFV